MTAGLRTRIRGTCEVLCWRSCFSARRDSFAPIPSFSCVHDLQEELQRLEWQVLPFVHRYFQGITEVPAGLTLSDIDALLGSDQLACDVKSVVYWVLEKWHEQRNEPLNPGLVLIYVKLEASAPSKPFSVSGKRSCPWIDHQKRFA